MPINSPYEIHITVAQAVVTKFVADCKYIGVKPLLIALHNTANEGTTFLDMQTSCVVHHESLDKVKEEAMRLTYALEHKGYTIVRIKIECPLNNVDVPCVANYINLSDGQYFEAHFAVPCDKSQIMDLRRAAQKIRGHLSINAFKANQDGTMIMMITLRNKCQSKEEFKIISAVASYDIAAHGFSSTAINEFALYDTNEAHDNNWLHIK